MSVWILFVLIKYTSGHQGGLANFQQEFKTKEACGKGSALLVKRYETTSTSVATICIEVGQ